MLTRGLKLFRFGLIKALKQKEIPLSIQQLAQCRIMLKMNPNTQTDLKASCSSYLNDRASKFTSPNIQGEKILAKWQQIRPLQCEMNVLSTCSQFNNLQRKYVDSLMAFWNVFFLSNKKRYSTFSSPFQQRYQNAFREYFNVSNQLIYLMTLNQTNLTVYLKLKLVKGKKYSQLRFIFDALLTLPSISSSNIQYLLFFTSKYIPYLFYFNKEQQILRYIYDRVPKNWTSYHKDRIVKNIIYSLTFNNSPPDHLAAGIPTLLQSEAKLQIKFRCFVWMVQFFIIDTHNIRQSQYLELISKFATQMPLQSMRILAKLFYNADIWVPQFWKKYFSFIQQGNNYKQVYTIDHYIIDDLITSGMGGSQFRQQALQVRHFLKGKGVDLLSVDFREQLEGTFGRLKDQKHTCQSLMANTLRLMGNIEITTQTIIKYFAVDILIDKKIVIEINGQTHYKTINGVTHLSLKSQFRQRMLTKLGFIVKNIKIEDLTNSNYSMLESLYKLVQSSGYHKLKVPDGVVQSKQQ